MGFPRILFSISNPFTYRNLFCTPLAQMLASKFDAMFCVMHKEMAERVRASVPTSQVWAAPLQPSLKSNLCLQKQLEYEAVAYPGISRSLHLDYKWSNDTRRRYLLRRWLRLGRPRPKVAEDGLSKAMEDSRKVLLSDPLTSEIMRLMRETKPDFVWLGTPNFPLDQIMLVVSHEEGIPVITAVLGWDNLSSKTLPVLPSIAYLIWGETMQQDLDNYFKLTGKRAPAFKVGSPQFDVHAHYLATPSDPRQDAALYGLDRDRPIALYGGSAPQTMEQEPDLVLQLIDAARSKVSGHLQWCIRLHPKDDRLQWEQVRKLDNVVLYRPCTEDNFESWLPEDNQLAEMVKQIGFSDVVLNNASTLTLDACALGKPVICIHHNPGDGRFHKSDLLFEYDHFRYAVESEAFSVCNTVDEVCHELSLGLRDPEKRAQQRASLVRSVIGPLDGKSSERIVDALRQITQAYREC